MSGHGHVEHHGNKGIALVISVLALVLAFSETLGKSAQTAGIAANIEASNLWAFSQAKTIRQTTMRTAADALQAEFGEKAPESAKKQIENWKNTAERYQSEPETGEGRKELAERAQAAEKKRDRSMAAYQPLRARVGRCADRDRHGVGFDHHVDPGARLDRRHAGRGGCCVLRDRLLV